MTPSIFTDFNKHYKIVTPIIFRPLPDKKTILDIQEANIKRFMVQEAKTIE